MKKTNYRAWDKIFTKKSCCFCFCILTAILIYSCSSGSHNNLNKPKIPIDSQIVGGPIFFNHIKADEGTIISPLISYNISTEGQDSLTIPLGKNIFWTQANKAGKHVYYIKYPKKVLARNYESFFKDAGGGGKGASANFAGAIANVRYHKMKILWIDEGDYSDEKFKLKSNQKGIIIYGTKKIEIPIEIGMCTKIVSNYALKLVKDGKFRQYTGDLKSVKIGNTAPIYIFGDVKPATIENTKVLYKKAEIFLVNDQDLFNKVTKTSILLDWKIRYSNKDVGKLILAKSVLEDTFYLSVDLLKQSDMRTLVTISAYSLMQNTENKASNLSQKYIDEFCTVLGT